MSRLRGVLLDVDGTLIDSNDAHARSWEDTFREFGFDIPASRVRPLIGMGGDKLLPELTGLEAENELAQRMAKRRSEIFKKSYLPTIRAFPRVDELIERWKSDGLRLVIATSAQRDELNGLLEQSGLDTLIERTTSSSDADRSKPDPDIVHAALVKADCTPKEAIFIGDTPYDIEAGNRIGVAVIALRCGGWWTDRSFQGAAAVYDDPDDLVEHYLLSPFKRPLALSR